MRRRFLGILADDDLSLENGLCMVVDDTLIGFVAIASGLCVIDDGRRIQVLSVARKN